MYGVQISFLPKVSFRHIIDTLKLRKKLSLKDGLVKGFQRSHMVLQGFTWFSVYIINLAKTFDSPLGHKTILSKH